MKNAWMTIGAAWVVAGCVSSAPGRTEGTDGGIDSGSTDSGVTKCGGIAGIRCPHGRVCVDDPTDTCDPMHGGADCSGICEIIGAGTLVLSGEDEGWTSGFADYPPDVEADWNFASDRRALPRPLTTSMRALFIGGDNHSDDLFMFWKRRIPGLVPNKSYSGEIQLTFATQAPKGCAGPGGPPGEGVWVKAGLTAIEPIAVANATGQQPPIIMNVDKGIQASGGKDAVVLGDVAKTNPNCNDRSWEMKTLAMTAPFVAKAGTDGALWLMFGTDSGYEDRTELYYSEVRVTLVAR